MKQLVPTTDVEIEEQWVREIAEPRARAVHAVEAVKSPRYWQVIVSVMEFIRDVPLEVELRRRIIAALRAVPGVVDVAEEDREVWLVRGNPKGSALIDAVAPVVDELAPRARAEIERDLAE